MEKNYEEPYFTTLCIAIEAAKTQKSLCVIAVQL